MNGEEEERMEEEKEKAEEEGNEEEEEGDEEEALIAEKNRRRDGVKGQAMSSEEPPIKLLLVELSCMSSEMSVCESL